MNPLNFSVLASTAQSDQSDNMFCISVSLNLIGYNATNMKIWHNFGRFIVPMSESVAGDRQVRTCFGRDLS